VLRALGQFLEQPVRSPDPARPQGFVATQEQRDRHLQRGQPGVARPVRDEIATEGAVLSLGL
jgi:hypothetical protein